MPPHSGHLYLARYAMTHVERLYVVVSSLQREPIDGALRARWMRESLPDAHILHLTDENPQYPEEHPDFWNIWRESLLGIMPVKPDLVFAGEDYGAPLAQTLGAEFMPIPMGRALIPISATHIRDNPLQHWNYISPAARPYFVQHIYLTPAQDHDAETLNSIAAMLAAEFETVSLQHTRGEPETLRAARLNALESIAHKYLFIVADKPQCAETKKRPTKSIFFDSSQSNNPATQWADDIRALIKSAS